MRKQLVIRTENSRYGKKFIDFFRDLKGEVFTVLDVGLVGLTARNTKSVYILVTDENIDERQGGK